MRRNEQVEAVVRELRKVGVRWLVEQTNGNHVRVSWIVHGNPRHQICSLTSRNYHAPRSAAARTRKLLRMDGLIEG